MNRVGEWKGWKIGGKEGGEEGFGGGGEVGWIKNRVWK